ncbi:MAG: hypothetical protein ACJAS1_007123 [Oleiphilaceae bacterium]
MFRILLSKKIIRSILILTPFILLIACSSPVTIDTSHKTAGVLQTRAEWRALLKWPQVCDDGVSNMIKYLDDFVGVDVYAWSAGRKLVSVVCETGAYTRGEMLFLETGEETERFNLLVFPQFKAIADAPQELNLANKGQQDYYQYSRSLLWGNLKIDNSSGNISNDAFYRGGGGCGVSTTYSLLNDEPVVVSLRTQQCEDKDIPISEWKIQPQSEYSKWPVVK